MTQPDKLPGSPEDWLAHAASDLQYARLGCADPLVLPAHVCFHAQQCVEKALKALLRARSVDFPLVHDIRQLLDVLKQAGIAAPPSIVDARGLTRFAVKTRYPVDWDPIEPTEVATAIDLAAAVLAWVRELIAESESNPKGNMP